MTLPIGFNSLDLVRGNKIQLRKILCKDRIKYFKLHNATYTHGILEIKLNEFMVKGNFLIIYENCNGLTKDLKCKYHGKPQQPEVCHSPNILLNKDIPGVVVTENCLYRWK
jgi:hypothetical protein